MEISFYTYIEKYYLILSNLYSSPLLPGSTLVLLGLLYFLVAPKLVRKNSLHAFSRPFSAFFLGGIILLTLTFSIFLFTIGIFTIPLALLLSVVLLFISLLASVNVFIFTYGTIFKALKKPLPNTLIANYIFFLAAVVIVGFFSLVPKIGSLFLTILFIMSIGNTCRTSSINY